MRKRGKVVTSAGLRTSQFDYELPVDLIAQEPLADRAAARMMVVDRERGELTHACVRDLPAFLRKGDLLVLNNTRVIPARIRGHKRATGGQVELLLLEEVAGGEWEALCGASRRPRVGSELVMADGRIVARVAALLGDGKVRVSLCVDGPVMEALEAAGVPPLPPYIKRSPDRSPGHVQRDREYYQTVYARIPGAVAAPTAGLHFTPALLDDLAAMGVGRVELTLHVGMGTFKPVTAEDVAHHTVDTERFELTETAAAAVNETRAKGGRVVAAGSTAVRALETCAEAQGRVAARQGRTGLFIHAPYTFRVVDGILTNFHLPRSTLLMMMSAFAGHALLRRAYDAAIQARYRFYSYGDCMLIV
jgi:S-adenosylmethionine:tRNA ribosyltransferase-isomerase